MPTTSTEDKTQANDLTSRQDTLKAGRQHLLELRHPLKHKATVYCSGILGCVRKFQSWGFWKYWRKTSMDGVLMFRFLGHSPCTSLVPASLLTVPFSLLKYLHLDNNVHHINSGQRQESQEPLPGLDASKSPGISGSPETSRDTLLVYPLEITKSNRKW